MKRLLPIIFLILVSCSTSRLVESYRNPDIDNPKINKILVIGITPKDKTRKRFEKNLVQEFRKRDIQGVASIDFFDPYFTSSKQSEHDLAELEEKLLDLGFNTVLMSRIKSVQDKVSLGQAFKSFSGNFSRDYYQNQALYLDEPDNTKKIYITETALYRLSRNKNKEVIWRARIDLINPKIIDNSINEYIDILISALGTEDLLNK
ncbi:hypothetical protein [Salegentibacter chungangensis]|uniref:Cardiolipin synthetase n=1 Tax=Salegentibacter chungangensis TaxID=1335724 RepID=A0ABW3NRI3_9FLAO